MVSVQLSQFLYFVQMTSCKHEFHLQCVLEWYLFIFLQYLFEISDKLVSTLCYY